MKRTKDPRRNNLILRGLPFALLGLCAFGLAGCGDEPLTSLRLTVEFSVALDQLEVTLQPEGETGPEPRLVPETATSLASGLRVLLLVPDEWDGKNVAIGVDGLLAQKEVARGSSVATVLWAAVTDVPVKLQGCSDVCVVGTRECVGDSFRRCEKDSLGCAAWSVPEACPKSAPYCSNGACAATCTDECTKAGEKRCATGGVVGTQTCGQHDSDSCLDWGPVLGCQVMEICLSGSCVPGCKPDCSGRQCGPDPLCGTSCGTCTKGNCNAQGKCTTVCTPAGPLVVDSAGEVGQYTSLGIDSSGRVHITYYDSTNNDLKYATNTSGTWQTFIVDSQGGYEASLAVDGSDKVHISYLGGGLNYATNASGSWKTSFVGTMSCFLGGGTSLALDGAGKAHISYCTQYQTSMDSSLMYATNTSGSWQSFTLDIPFMVGWVGLYSSIGVDGAGKVHISYFGSVNQDLKYATNALGSWKKAIIDSDDVGQYTSLVLDASGKVHISYYDLTNKDLKYATNASGTWQAFTIVSSGDVGLYTSLKLDASGKVHISYSDLANGDLRYTTNASGTWKTSTIDSQGSVGWDTSLGLDALGTVHISYHDETNRDLKYVAICP